MSPLSEALFATIEAPGVFSGALVSEELIEKLSSNARGIRIAPETEITAVSAIAVAVVRTETFLF